MSPDMEMSFLALLPTSAILYLYRDTLGILVAHRGVVGRGEGCTSSSRFWSYTLLQAPGARACVHGMQGTQLHSCSHPRLDAFPPR